MFFIIKIVIDKLHSTKSENQSEKLDITVHASCPSAVVKTGYAPFIVDLETMML